MEDVHTALDAAKWKEIVTIQSNDGGQAVQGVPIVVNLRASLDTVHGGLQWNAIPDEEVIARHLEAKQWILPMLNDTRRNQLYYQAIRQATETLQQQSLLDAEQCTDTSNDVNAAKTTTPIRVLDLGCGTGLLGLMAVQLCSAVQVTAVDMSSVMTHLATQTVADNDHHRERDYYSQRITVLEGHSTQLPPMRAHLCVSELLEDGLLGEGWLPAIRDAWKRHMCTSSSGSPLMMIPAGATVWAQLVQGPWLRNYIGPRPYAMQNKETFQFNANSPKHRDDTTSLATLATAVVPMHVVHLLRQGLLMPLSDPVQVLDFDVTHPDRIPSPKGRTVQRTITVQQAGTVHGILVWWKLQLGPGIEYDLYNENESSTIRQDHWHPCIHVLECALSTAQDQSWTLQASHDDYNIHLSLLTSAEDSVAPAAKRQASDIENDTIRIPRFPPGRVLQLNSSLHLQSLERGISKVLQEVKESAIVLDVSDFCVGAMMAARLGARHVLTLERLEATATACAIHASGLSRHVTALQGHYEQITANVLSSTCPTDSDADQVIESEPSRDLVIVAEPSYTQLYFWPHLEAIQMYYVVRALSFRLKQQSQDVPKWNIHATPVRAYFWAAALQSPELAQAYGPCDALHATYGLDHSYVSQEHFGSSNVRELSLSLWQYDYQLLTEPMVVGILPYHNSSEDAMRTRGSSTFAQRGTCHGIVVWVSYDHTFNDRADDRAYDSKAGSPNHPSVLGSRQLIYLWRESVQVEELEQELWVKLELEPEPKFDFGMNDNNTNQ